MPPHKALEDIFKRGSEYTFECATAITIVHYKAMLDLLGPKDFDRICSDLRIGAWVNEDHLHRYKSITGSAVDATPDRRASLDVGDYGYFKNWDVSEAGFAAGWQGENVIYLGDGRFYGHPFGVTTEDEIVASLNGERKAGSTRPASFLDLRIQLLTGVLDEDRVPE
jgi:protein-glutamine gamma-glutamyltransferase